MPNARVRLSLASMDSSSRSSPRPGQTLLACYFASPGQPATGPFGCRTPCPSITLGQVTFHRTFRYGARATRYLRFGSPVFASSLTSAPPWGFRPSGSTLAGGTALRRHMRETKSLAKRLTAKNRPISLHSPQPVLEFLLKAADHRSRSATFLSAQVGP